MHYSGLYYCDEKIPEMKEKIPEGTKTPTIKKTRFGEIMAGIKRGRKKKVKEFSKINFPNSIKSISYESKIQGLSKLYAKTD